MNTKLPPHPHLGLLDTKQMLHPQSMCIKIHVLIYKSINAPKLRNRF